MMSMSSSRRPLWLRPVSIVKFRELMIENVGCSLDGAVDVHSCRGQYVSNELIAPLQSLIGTF